jgi:hypothetical protein
MKHNKPIAVCQLLPEVLSQMQAMSIKRLDGWVQLENDHIFGLDSLALRVAWRRRVSAFIITNDEWGLSMMHFQKHHNGSSEPQVILWGRNGFGDIYLSVVPTKITLQKRKQGNLDCYGLHFLSFWAFVNLMQSNWPNGHFSPQFKKQATLLHHVSLGSFVEKLPINVPAGTSRFGKKRANSSIYYYPTRLWIWTTCHQATG